MRFHWNFFLLILCVACAQGNTSFTVQIEEVITTDVGLGWASNSVNATIFRKNSVVSNDQYQYTAYYDQEAYLVLAKRNVGEHIWRLQRTPYQGNVKDAHNSISIMVDGAGYLHVSWDHHNNPLRYARSIAPDTLVLGELENMTGMGEDVISYPEFYKMPNGNLLFFYRNGGSGNGNLVINQYDLNAAKWTQVQSNLLDGEGQRNAYWQACVDSKGDIHVSWVWRETWDVSSNHDLNYARSRDGGVTWETSRGRPYKLPISIKNAELIHPIPQKSELINQTSMAVNAEGKPAIAIYFKSKETNKPEFHVVYQAADNSWKAERVSARRESFSLSGGGTKRIPISRPQLLFGSGNNASFAAVIFRDEERGNRPSLYYNEHFPTGKWEVADLSRSNLGSWEPSYDTELWMNKGMLSLFVQKVDQVDGEGVSSKPPQMVSIVDWKP